MHGGSDEVIYVGKAVNLKNRVRQYFQSPDGKSPKIRRMISLITRFEYIIVDSELEALVLENNLIKEYLPRYNTLLKDDKTYPYIKVTTGEAFPRILLTRKLKKDKARYFGPFTSVGAVRESVDLLHRLFRIRTCQKRLPEDIGKERPCLYYHIGQCSGPCGGCITEEDYRRSIDKALDFLAGKYEYVQSYLKEKMETAAETADFEKAIEYRDLLKDIEALKTRQKVVSLKDSDDRDIIGISRKGGEAVCQVFFIRDGRMIGREHYRIETDEEEEQGELVSSFIKQFYSGSPYIPGQIWIQTPVREQAVIEEWLSGRRGRKVNLVVPRKGSREKLVEMAVQNASELLEKQASRLKREAQRTTGAVHELEEILGISGIRRMESYDISNTSGFESVASMVVFGDGSPRKNDYRKFRIRTVQGPNDYASMEEVLTRRFTHGLKELEEGRSSSFTAFPDLILMDGGKGQVHVAEEVLRTLDIHIPVCGMVKDDRHRTRGLYFHDEELPIDRHSEAFQLLTRIQDETHRFAIEYHKSLRGSKNVKSVLDDIPGIGPARRRALLRAFRSLEAIAAADEEALSALPEMNAAAAREVYLFFHKT